MFDWRVKQTGLIAPDERLPWPQTIAMGIQHVLAAFGATIVAPLLMGFNPPTALFFSGVGTILFFLLTKGRVPSYLGSSFAFIGPVGAVMGSAAAGNLNAADMPKALGGIVAAGVVYAIIGGVVAFTGAGWIDALMPPLVTGAVVMIIGLNLAGAARNLAANDPAVAIVTVLAILAIALYTRGVIGRLPILLGAVVGYVVALALGGPTAEGRTIVGLQVHGVDFSGVASAAWFGLPTFTAPQVDGRAISLIAPVALVLVAENLGHIKAVGAMTQRDLMPYLGRGFLGDGLATVIAGIGGGTGVTTYAENIGTMAVTRVYSSALFVVAALVALALSLSPKFGALVGSIPGGVLGGVSTVLFGLIAVTGGRIWVENGVDFRKGINLFVAAVAVIAGAADYTLRIGSFELGGIGVGTFGAIILYQLLKLAPTSELEREQPYEGAADAAVPQTP